MGERDREGIVLRRPVYLRLTRCTRYFKFDLSGEIVAENAKSMRGCDLVC
jgi:hypothetical protein